MRRGLDAVIMRVLAHASRPAERETIAWVWRWHDDAERGLMLWGAAFGPADAERLGWLKETTGLARVTL